jgi:hypothetical protein
MQRCEDCSHFDIRIGAAAVWVGVAGSVAACAWTRSGVPGFVAAGTGSRRGFERGFDWILCADAYGYAIGDGIGGECSKAQYERNAVCVWAVCDVGGGKLSKSWRDTFVRRRV